MAFFRENGETCRVFKTWLRIVGVWPLDSNKREAKIVFSLTLLAKIVILLAALIHPLLTCLQNEFQKALTTRIVIIILGVLSQTILRIHGSRMIPLIEAVTKDWSTITEPKERDIMKRHNRSGTIYLYGQASNIILMAIVSHLESFPFLDKVIFIDQENCADSDGNIWAKMIPYLTTAAYLLSEVSSFGSIVLFWSFSMHISGQYKILKKQFQEFLLIKEKKTSLATLRRLVERHCQLFVLSGTIEDSFSTVVAAKIFAIQILCCQFVLRLFTDDQTVQFGTAIIHRHAAMLLFAIVLYLCYYAGDYLTMCSEEIGEVLTQCKWYDVSKDSITNFSIVIARCQIPTKLTAVKMYRLNLSNLKYVFNATYSYVSCILVVAKD